MSGQTTIDLTRDSHVHTRLCNHASGEMEEYVTAALNRGLQTLVFLEHLEEDTVYFERNWLTEADFAYYFAEGKRLQEKYRHRLTIKLGVEVGFNPKAVNALREKIARYPWEHVGLSYHYYATGAGHLNMVSRRRKSLEKLIAVGVDKVITEYFSGLIRGISSLDCNTVCHLDAVMRHYPQVRFSAVHMEQIDRILELIKQKKMSLEVNTSGYAFRNEPYPGRTILKKALARNIPLLAGSDAHHPEQVGRYFDRLPALLASLQ
ncbi:MAG: histidinol-phosphatase [Desulfobulbaceae bacterium]|nr:histidinol-phosphatase [Desulfobulbaceae bacterium]